ncbi:tRNA (guanine-N(7)-)-methyltransferase [Bacilli bacterium]|nr:tRNA (guanine-N(7)-)-methyltransferase [Bacilli bacterium]
MAIIDNVINIRSFGRVNSRKVSQRAKATLENVLPIYAVNNVHDLPGRDETNHLEIGFGYGTDLALRAAGNPKINYIGCETYNNGIVNLLEIIEMTGLDNVKVFNGDARILISNMEDEYLDRVLIIFPDPWPKRRQQKRRLINEDFLALLEKKMKKYGTMFFSSDSRDYVEYVMNLMTKNKCSFVPNFKSLDECKSEPQWWGKTKYQIKAEQEGREVFFLEFMLG